jgi:DNA-binding sugar fermentation-stimulating protein
VRGEDKVVAIKAALLLRSRQYFPNARSQQEAKHLLVMVHAKNANKTIQATHT